MGCQECCGLVAAKSRGVVVGFALCVLEEEYEMFEKRRRGEDVGWTRGVGEELGRGEEPGCWGSEALKAGREGPMLMVIWAPVVGRGRVVFQAVSGWLVAHDRLLVVFIHHPWSYLPPPLPLSHLEYSSHPNRSQSL